MILISLLFAACSTPEAPAPAAPPAPAAAPPPAPAAAAPGHGGGDHSHASPHGGIVQTVGSKHIEALMMPEGVMFYLSDGDQKPLPIDGYAGTAVIKGPEGVATVTLMPMGDHLHAAAKLAQGQPASVVLTVTKDGKAESASFATETVGLQSHDHTSLHGGQVGMWGDYHLEYAPKDDTYRVWVTDAFRAAVTSGITGSLKDGDTVVPLTPDAGAGMLSGKGAGAGTRPVMVDIQIGEKSFSLGFNPVK